MIHNITYKFKIYYGNNFTPVFILFCRLRELKAFWTIFIFLKKFVHFISSYLSTFLRHYSFPPALKHFFLEYLMLSYRVLNPLSCGSSLQWLQTLLRPPWPSPSILLSSLTLRCIHTSFLVNRSILNRLEEFQPFFRDMSVVLSDYL